MLNALSKSVVAVSVVTLTGLLGFIWYQRKHKDEIPKKWRPVAKVSKIHIYPLKSGRRNELEEAYCTKFGIKSSLNSGGSNFEVYDRSFVVYGSESGGMMTAFKYPKLVLIEVTIQDDTHVSFNAPGMETLTVKIPAVGEAPQRTIFLHYKEPAFSLDCGEEAALWMSRYVLGKDDGARLGFHDAEEAHKRDLVKNCTKLVKFNYYKKVTNDAAGLYSDIFAIMLVNESSIDDLKQRVAESGGTYVDELNFRPNICIRGDGAPPFIEDYWDWVKIGDVVMRNIMPCTRCALTTTDPECGVRNQDQEPLRTLRTYRKIKDLSVFEEQSVHPVMGTYLAVVRNGHIHLNDTVYVGMEN